MAVTPEGTATAPTPDAAEFDAEQYKERSEFMTHSDIVALGYTPTYIRRFLGEPDRRAPNAKGRYPLRLYSKQRVCAAFATPEAKAAAQEMVYRRRLHSKAAKRRFEPIQDAIDSIFVLVRMEAPERLRRASYEWLKYHVSTCRLTCEQAAQLLSEAYLDRREYIFVRHMLTQFESHMQRFAGCRPRARVECAMIEHFNRRIVDHYPHLRAAAVWAADQTPSSCVALCVCGDSLLRETYNFGQEC